MRCSGMQKQLVIAFRETRKFVYTHAQKLATVHAVSQVRPLIGDKYTDLVLASNVFSFVRNSVVPFQTPP
jgi:hypothetical protein